jgi:hypothetical protein
MVTEIRKSEAPSGARSTPVKQSPTRTASDASGVNLENRGPIHPSMPHLPPA